MKVRAGLPGRITFRGVDGDRSLWLTLGFVTLGVVVPAACVLWFMNEAVKGQAAAAKQSVAEAYRGQMILVRNRLETDWEDRAAALQPAAASAGEDFARSVLAGTADSFIYRNSDGSIAYPTEANTPRSHAEPPEWRAAEAFEQNRNRAAAMGAWTEIAKSAADPSFAARAAQAEIRWILRGPDPRANEEAAIRAIAEYFSTGRAAGGTDLNGRLIAADEQLLALHLMQSRDPRRAAVLQRLTRMLNDYEHSPIPAAQRLFLMDEVRAIAPEMAFPTFDAERLAGQFLDEDDARPAGLGLQATRVPDLWKLASKSGRVIALYRTSTVLGAMRATLDDGNPGHNARISAVPPGVPSEGETIVAGGMLPGWQLALSIADPGEMDRAARARMASYLWVGYLVIGAMAIAGLFAGQFFRRQIRLARLKTDLVGTVSHEIKTPLASMRLLVDSLLEDAAPNSRKTREYLELISAENLRLTRLVENFLTFSRVERKRHSLELQQLEPAEVVASVNAIVGERFQSAQCDFIVTVDPCLPSIRADSDAILTALLNLLDNAYKYTASEKRIRLRATSEAGAVVFEVEDNGIGISAREQRRIFRRFYQVDRRLARETGGCGLGLSIVDSIVRAHGGSVRVTSRLGVGSTFRVCLPSEERAA